jgi:hypothetical protein
MKSVSTMVIEEVTSLAYHKGLCRVSMRSVTDEEIPEDRRLPPSAIALTILVSDDRAKWYAEHLGEYCTLEIRKRD